MVKVHKVLGTFTIKGVMLSTLHIAVMLAYCRGRLQVNSSADTCTMEGTNLHSFTTKENSMQRLLHDLPVDTEQVTLEMIQISTTSWLSPFCLWWVFLWAYWQRMWSSSNHCATFLVVINEKVVSIPKQQNAVYLFSKLPVSSDKKYPTLGNV